jgi:hypothetical protein
MLDPVKDPKAPARASRRIRMPGDFTALYLNSDPSVARRDPSGRSSFGRAELGMTA